MCNWKPTPALRVANDSLTRQPPALTDGLTLDLCLFHGRAALVWIDDGLFCPVSSWYGVPWWPASTASNHSAYAMRGITSTTSVGLCR